MESLTTSEGTSKENDNKGRSQAERRIKTEEEEEYTLCQSQNSNDNNKELHKSTNDAKLGKHVASASTLESRSLPSGSMFTKQSEDSPYKHSECQTPGNLRGNATAEMSSDVNWLSSRDPAQRFYSISSTLFEFSRHYKRLEKDTNGLPEVVPSDISLEKLTELYQKSQEERQHLRDIITKLLLDRGIGGSRDEIPSGILKNSESSEEVPQANCGETVRSFKKCGCERNVVMDGEERCTIHRQKNLSDKCIQTEEFSSQDCAGNQTENETDCGQATETLYDIKVLQQRCKRLEEERNQLELKVFEVESELCSAEVDRDLKQEEARYLEEQVCSVRAMSSMRDNDLVSLRKRYKFLNEAFQNSEELRETLEKENYEMAKSIVELEKRLEGEENNDISDDNLIGATDLTGTCILEEVCSVAVHDELSKEVGRLKKEVSTANETLEKERAQKESVEKMMGKIQNERCLLLKELDTCKGGAQRQNNEVKELRDRIHSLTKQSKQQQREQDKKQQQKQHQQENDHELRIRLQSKQILELQNTISQHYAQIQILKAENKKLEEELYEQLDIIEKSERENRRLLKEQEDTTSHLKKVSLNTVGELVASYSKLKAEKVDEDQKMPESRSSVSKGETSGSRNREVDANNIGLPRSGDVSSIQGDVNYSCKLYSVPRSEYVKVTFKLNALREEMKNLKEVAVPGAMRNFSVRNKALKEQRTSLKKENKKVKKCLKTLKDRVSAVTVEDEGTESLKLMLQTQLHETQAKLNEKEHELDKVKNEIAMLLGDSIKQKDALRVLKEHLAQEEEIRTDTFDEFKKKVENLEKQLQRETEGHAKTKAEVVVLEEQNSETSHEFQKVQLRLEDLQRQKEAMNKEFNEIKVKMIRYFGNESLEILSDSWNSKKRECVEYEKIVENNKHLLLENRKELVALTDVNTALRKQLNETKTHLENETLLNTKKVKELENNEIDCNREIVRFQSELKILKLQLKKKEETLQINKTDKEDLERLRKELDVIHSELKQAKLSLSEKEDSCQAYMVVIEELQRTCKVYEDEFARISLVNNDASLPGGNTTLSNFKLELSNISEDRLSETESDLSVETLQEFQEMQQGNLSTKVETHQEKDTELVENGVQEGPNKSSGKRYDSVNAMLESKLHESRFNLNEKQNELEMVEKEKVILLNENIKQEKALDVLKDQLIQQQKMNEKNLQEFKEKYKNLENELQDEIKERMKEKNRIVSLEEHNSVLNDDYENVKHKLDSLLKEKEVLGKQFTEMKCDVIKYFGSESLQSVSNSCNLMKRKCADYGKIIDNNKCVISEVHKDMAKLKDVSAKLQIECIDARKQLQTEISLHSQKSEEVHNHKIEISRLHDVIEVLENNFEKDKGVLEAYKWEKKESERLRNELDAINSELNDARTMLSEKEKQCECYRTATQELETTCRVYEEEFHKSTKKSVHSSPKKMLLELDLEQISESEEESSPESESDTTVKNLQDLQEKLHAGLSTKVKFLENTVGELMEELCACRKQNEHLQQRLHFMAMTNLENEAKKRDDELDKVLNRLFENEKSSGKQLQRNSKGINNESNDKTNSEHLIATLSRYKEIIARLRVENTTYEEQLTKAQEETVRQKEKLAMLDYYIREYFVKSTVVDVNADIVIENIELEKKDNNLDLFIKEEIDDKHSSSCHSSVEHLIIPMSRLTAVTMTTNDSAMAELECLTAKYVNLRAAFEGCQRRLRFLEGEESVERVIENGAVSLVRQHGVYNSSPPSASLGDICFEGNEEGEVHIFGSTPKEEVGSVSTQKNMFTQTDNEMDNTSGDSCLFSTAMSIDYSENEINQDFRNGEDNRMVIEVTLKMDDDNFLVGEGNATANNEVELQNCLTLKEKTEKLERLVVSSRDELHRIKVSSFAERLGLESELEYNLELHNESSQKRKGLELDKKKQDKRLAKVEENLILCRQETERIKICSFKEREYSGKIIMDNQINIDQLRYEKNDLYSKIEALNEKSLGCYDEIHRIKVCSFNERSTFESETVKLKKAHENCENLEKLPRLRMNSLEEQLLHADETRQISSFDIEKKNFQVVIETLQTTITNLEKENKNLKKDKNNMESKMTELMEKESLLMGEKEKLENNVQMLQDGIVSKENIIQEHLKGNDVAKSKIKRLEDNTLSLTKEGQSYKLYFSAEKERLELIISDLQDRLHASNNEILKEQKIKDQLTTKIRQLEEKVVMCNDETQRIKASSLKQRENLEHTVKEKCSELTELKRTSEKYYSSYKRTIYELEESVKELQDEQAVTLNEVSLAKGQLNAKCQSNRELEETFFVTCEELKLSRTKLDKVETEKADLVKEHVKLASELLNGNRNTENIRKEAEKLRVDNDILLRKHKDNESSLEVQIEKLQVSDQENKDLTKKLIHTEKEMKELQDIMEELKRAKKKVEYEMEKAGETMQVCNDEIKNLREEVENLREENTCLETKVSNYENENSILLKRTEAQEQEATLLRNSLMDIQKEKENYESLLKVEKKELEGLQQRAKAQEEEATLLKNKLTDVQKEKESVEYLLMEVKKELDDLKHRTEAEKEEDTVLRQSLTKLQHEKENTELTLKALEEQATDCRQRAEAQEEEGAHLRSSLLEIPEEKENYECLLEEVTKEHENLKHSMEAQEKETTLLRSSLMEVQKEKQNYECLSEEATKELEDFKQRTEAEKEKNITLRKCLTKLQHEKENTELSLKELEDELKHWKQRTEAQEEEETHLRSRLIEMQEAKENYECLLQEVKKELEDLKQSTEAEKEEDTFLRKSLTKLQHEKENTERSLKEMEEQLKHWKQRTEAQEEEETHLRSRLIEMQEAKENYECLLQEVKKELEDLKQSTEAEKEEDTFLRKSLTKLQHEKENTERSLKDLEEQLNHWKQRTEAQEEEETHLRSRLMEVQEEKENYECLLKEVTKELEDLKQRTEAEKEEETVLRKNLTNLQHEKENIARSLKELEEQLKDWKQRTEAQEEEETHLRSRLIEMQETKENYECLLQEVRKELEDLKQSTEAQKEEETALRKSLTSLHHEKENTARSLKELEEQLKDWKQRTEAQEEEETHLRSRLIEMQEAKENYECLLQEVRKELEDLKQSTEAEKEEDIFLRKSLTKLQHEKENTERSLKELEEQLKHWKQRTEAQEEEETHLRSRLMGVQEEKENYECLLKEVTKELEDLKQRTEAEKEEATVLSNNLLEVQKEKENYECLLKETRKELKDLKQRTETREKEAIFFNSGLLEVREEKESGECLLIEVKKELEDLKQRTKAQEERDTVLRKSLTKLQNEKDSTERSLKELEGQLKGWKQRTKAQEEEETHLRSWLVEVQDENENYECLLQKVTKELEDLKQRAEAEKEEATVLNNSFIEVQKEKDNYESLLKGGKKEFENLKQKTVSQEEELTHLKNSLMEVQKENESGECLLKQVKKEFEDFKQRTEAEKEEDTILRKSVTNLQHELENTELSLKELEDEVKDWKQRAEAQEEEETHLRSRLMEVVEEKENYECLLKEVRKELEDLKQRTKVQEERDTVLRKRLTQLQREKENTELSLKELEDEVKDWEQRAEAQMEEVKLLRKEVKEVYTEKMSSEQLLKALKEELGHCNQTAHAQREKIIILGNRLTDVEKERDDNEHSLNASIEGQEGWKQETLASREEATLLRSSLVELRKEDENSKSLLNELKDELEEWKEKTQAKQEEIIILKDNLTILGKEKEYCESSLEEIVEQQRKDEENFIEIAKKHRSEMDFLTEQLQIKVDEISVLRNDIEKLQNENLILASTMKARREEKLREKDYLQATMEKHQEEVDVWKSKCYDYENEIKILRTNIDHIKNEKESIEKQVMTLNQEKQEQRNGSEHIIRTLEQKNGLLEQKIQSCEEETKVFEEKLKNMENNKADIDRLFAVANKQIQKQKEALQESIVKHENEINLLTQEITGGQTEIRHLKENMEASLKETEIKCIEIEKLRVDLETKENDYREIVANHSKEIDIWKNKVNNREREMSSLREELNKEKDVAGKKVAEISHNKDREADRLKKFVEELKKQKEDAERVLDEIKIDKRSEERLQNVIVKLEHENELLKHKEDANDKQLFSFKSLIEELEREKMNAETDVKNVNAMYENARQQNSSLVGKLSLIEKDNLDLKKNMEKLKEEKEEMKIRIEILNHEKQLGLKDLSDVESKLKMSGARELALKEQGKAMEEEKADLRSQIGKMKEKVELDTNEKLSLENSIKECREKLNILRGDIEEAARNKSEFKKELYFLHETIEKESTSWKREQDDHNQNVLSMREIVSELMKGKQTLLEEISALSDKKKEMGTVNTELLKTGKVQVENERLKHDNSKLEFQISSLKVSLDTLQAAYEQSQDEITQNKRHLEELKQDKQKFMVGNTGLRKQLSALENKIENTATEHTQLMSSLEAKEIRLHALEKEHETYKNENVTLIKRLKIQEENENTQPSESGSSTTQVSNLRKKMKELRSKLSEEKKQRQILEFEIKNLKDKVERFTGKEKQLELQLENNRKSVLEIKTERDSIAIDLETVKKRAKRDVEGYASTIQSLEYELKKLREREVKSENGKHTKEAFDAINEQNKMLEIKLVANTGRYSKENDELKTSLELLEQRYNAELILFKDTKTSNQHEMQEAKKSLSTMQREIEHKACELEKLQNDLCSVNQEKTQVVELLQEKSSEAMKWKKEAFDSKAEINFLRGALNILEKEGLGDNLENSRST